MGVSRAARRLGTRVGALIACAIGLYVVAPSVLTVLDAWPQLGDVKPWWFVVVVVLEALSFASLWLLLRIALPGSAWVDVATSQLAGNSASRIIPGGAATGAVIQGRMLIRSGHSPAGVGTVLSATGLLTTGVLLGLPVLTLPALLFGPPLAHQLEVGLIVSLVIAAVLVAAGLALLKWDAVVTRVGLAAGVLIRLVRGTMEPARVSRALVRERDTVAAAFRGRWGRALASAAGNRMFDFACLVAALLAVGANANPSLVLVAYVASVGLGLVPITPGGLGFVEAGLTTLLVLAGVTADQAVVGTLLYRLASYWLPIPVGALAWAGWRIRPERTL